MRLNKTIVCLVLVLLTFLGANFASAESQTNPQPLKVGFVLCGPITDNGWNQSHNDGRLYLEKTMGSKVQTIFAESVPENSEAGRVIEKMIAQGVKIIFTTSYGFFEPALQAAARHPDVVFMQINRYSEQKRANVGVYFPYYFEPMYAAGVVAGKMTKTNKIGFIVGHAVSNVLAVVNSFTLGAQSVNPKVKVHLVCTNSWNDPVTESEATKALAESGVDVVASNLDSSLTVCLAAEKAKIYCIGTHFDLKKQIPKSWLTGASWNYGPLYVRIVQEIIDGSWRSGTNYYASKDGYARLASFGSIVPSKVQKEALNALQKINQEKIIVFSGPIKDSTGKLRIPAGKTADNHCIEQMNWVVPGLEGYSAK